MKIADFGLAKATSSVVTRGVGTPAFMAPELFDDADEPDKYVANELPWVRKHPWGVQPEGGAVDSASPAHQVVGLLRWC